MNWSKFQQLGFDIAEEGVKSTEQDIMNIYSDVTKTINDRLAKQYAKYLSAIDTSDYYNEMLKYNRLNEMLKQIQADYVKASGTIAAKTKSALASGMSDNYYLQQFAMNWATPGARYTVLPKSLVELSVLGTEDSFKKVSVSVVKKFGDNVNYMPPSGSLSRLFLDNRAAEIKQIRKSIITSLITGTPYADTAKEITRIIGTATKDAITGARYKSLRIIRTETTRILNAGAYANDMQAVEQGIKIVREWQATLDVNTRDRHQRLDGQKRGVDKRFSMGGDSALYPGGFSAVRMNVNCRCTVITYPEKMKPDIRVGRNPVTGKNEIFNYKNYEEWRKDNDK